MSQVKFILYLLTISTCKRLNPQLSLFFHIHSNKLSNFSKLLNAVLNPEKSCERPCHQGTPGYKPLSRRVLAKLEVIDFLWAKDTCPYRSTVNVFRHNSPQNKFSGPQCARNQTGLGQLAEEVFLNRIGKRCIPNLVLPSISAVLCFHVPKTPIFKCFFRRQSYILVFPPLFSISYISEIFSVFLITLRIGSSVGLKFIRVCLLQGPHRMGFCP